MELGITLIVGFLIGFFANSFITNKRIEGLSSHKGEMMFWRRALEEVGATKEQKQTIFPIIKEYADETREILNESWKQLPPIWQEMENDIMQELTKEQQQEFKRFKADHKSRKPEQQRKYKNRENRENRGNREMGKPREHQRPGPERRPLPPPPHPER